MNASSRGPLRAAEPVDDGGCIVCGPHNALGLGLRFHRTDDGVRAEATLPEWFAGWQGLAHGGAVSMLLDEAMAYAALAAGRIAVTAGMTLRFREAVPTVMPLVVTGRVARARSGALWTQAWLRTPDGRELANAEGRFMVRRDLLPTDRIGALDG